MISRRLTTASALTLAALSAAACGSRGPGVIHPYDRDPIGAEDVWFHRTEERFVDMDRRLSAMRSRRTPFASDAERRAWEATYARLQADRDRLAERYTGLRSYSAQDDQWTVAALDLDRQADVWEDRYLLGLARGPVASAPDGTTSDRRAAARPSAATAARGDGADASEAYLRGRADEVGVMNLGGSRFGSRPNYDQDAEQARLRARADQIGIMNIGGSTFEPGDYVRDRGPRFDADPDLYYDYSLGQLRVLERRLRGEGRFTDDLRTRLREVRRSIDRARRFSTPNDFPRERDRIDRSLRDVRQSSGVTYPRDQGRISSPIAPGR